MPSSSRRYKVMVTTKSGSYRQVYHKGHTGSFTIKEKDARRGKHGYPVGNFTHAEAMRVVEKAKRHGWRHTLYQDKHYSYLTIKAGETWPTNHELLRRANELARHLHRRIHIVSGKRSMAEQWRLYNLWRAGKGAAANYPNKNDDHIAGNAMDCGIIDAHGRYWNIGEHPKIRGTSQALLKRFGLSLPYRPPYVWTWYNRGSNAEIWHLETLPRGTRRRMRLPTSSKYQ